MESCLQHYNDGYKPRMDVVQPTKNILDWISLLNHSNPSSWSTLFIWADFKYSSIYGLYLAL